MRYQRPKGTADILPGEAQKWNYVEETARMLFNDYRYQEIRTPMFENFDVFFPERLVILPTLSPKKCMILLTKAIVT